MPRRRCRTLARNCISSTCSWTPHGYRTTTARPVASTAKLHAPCDRERWWRRQNLAEWTARVDCTVLRTCQRLWKGCCDLRLRPSVAQLELRLRRRESVDLSLMQRTPLEVAEWLRLISTVALSCGDPRLSRSETSGNPM